MILEKNSRCEKLHTITVIRAGALVMQTTTLRFILFIAWYIGRTESLCDIHRLRRAVSVNRRAVWQIEFLMSRERRAPI